jgi:hypothetical protein
MVTLEKDSSVIKNVSTVSENAIVSGIWSDDNKNDDMTGSITN